MDKRKITALSAPALIVILLDQFSKHWIRLNPQWHYADLIPGWLTFNYTQNPGMALGMRWASTEVISGIAILATIAILSYVLYNREDATIGYLVCMGLIIGGAIGNIIDRLIMGYVESYGGLLEGHVIDFIHFNLRVSGYPVFPYIFNVADVAISTAIIAMLVFHQKVMPKPESGETDPQSQSVLSNPGSQPDLSSDDKNKIRDL